MEQIKLPEGLKEIKSHTFIGCENLKEIIIPKNVEEIGDRAFAACDELEKVVFQNDSVFFRGIFAGCSKLNLDTIAKNITKYNMEGITLTGYSPDEGEYIVTVPEGITEIGDYAFSTARYLNKIILPTSLRRIGYMSFYLCFGLEEVVFSEGLEEIGNNAFQECYHLNVISLPVSLKKIGTYAFNLCAGLKEKSKWLY